MGRGNPIMCWLIIFPLYYSYIEASCRIGNRAVRSDNFLKSFLNGERHVLH